MRSSCIILILGFSILWSFGCSKLRDEVINPPEVKKVTYKDDIKKILDDNCVRCHHRNSGVRIAEDIDLSTYFNIIQSGVAIPGDPNSRIVVATQPGGSMYPNVGSELNAEKIRRWVVEDSLAVGDIRIHPDEWMQVTSSKFHGRFIRRTGWNLDQCKVCHGSDYRGGISKMSCYSCHNSPGGPEACNTCHGNPANSAPPRDLENNFSTGSRGVGAHQSHLTESAFRKAIKCSECHIVPEDYRSPGHIFDDETPNIAEVIFNDSLSRIITADTIKPQPMWDPVTLTCSGTYCHGYFKNGNLSNAPKWNVVDGTQASCGTCHGLPPRGTHPAVSSTSCAQICHSDVVDEVEGQLRIKDKTRHINGKLNLFGQEQGFNIWGYR
jgi:predicted CxxxxCH...CXXCH cytochrome family protein